MRKNIISILVLVYCFSICYSLNAQALGPIHKLNDQNMPITLDEMPLSVRDKITGFTSFQMPTLPYSLKDLDPLISGNTMLFHYGKHTLAYMNNLNKLIKDSEFKNSSIEDIIKKGKGSLFNNAAQFWNHAFFFFGIRPLDTVRSLEPMGKLAEDLAIRYGSVEAFKSEFSEKASSLFGSGWVWLYIDKKGALQIKAMPNADNPIREGGYPIICIDVWEHAYYLDVQNKRADYISNWFKLVYWESADWLYRKIKDSKR